MKERTLAVSFLCALLAGEVVDQCKFQNGAKTSEQGLVRVKPAYPGSAFSFFFFCNALNNAGSYAAQVFSFSVCKEIKSPRDYVAWMPEMF